MVIQDTSNPVFINVDESDIEFDMNGGVEQARVVEFGPENVELKWMISTTDQGIVFQGDKEGNEQTDTSNPNGILDWKATADAMQNVDNLDYATKTATLILVATHKYTGEKQVKAIHLIQKKYGVTLEKSSIVCSGKTVKIRVKGNMNWKVAMKDDDGALLDRWIEKYDNDDTGSANDNYSNGDENAINIETLEQHDFDLDSKRLTLEFTDINNNMTCLKEVIAKKGLLVDNKLYEVLGPVEGSEAKFLSQRWWFDPVKYPKADIPPKNVAVKITEVLGGECFIKDASLEPVGVGDSGNEKFPVLVYRGQITGNTQNAILRWKYERASDGTAKPRFYEQKINISGTTGVEFAILWEKGGRYSRGKVVTVRPGGSRTLEQQMKDLKEANSVYKDADAEDIYDLAMLHDPTVIMNVKFASTWIPFVEMKNNIEESKKLQTYYINPID